MLLRPTAHDRFSAAVAELAIGDQDLRGRLVLALNIAIHCQEKDVPRGTARDEWNQLAKVLRKEFGEDFDPKKLTKPVLRRWAANVPIRTARTIAVWITMVNRTLEQTAK